MERQTLMRWTLRVAGLGLAVALVACFVFGDRFLTGRLPETGRLVLVDVPAWAGEALPAALLRTAGGPIVPLRPSEAAAVAQRLEGSCWLEHVRAQVGADTLEVRATWRRPVALVHSGTTRFYVDANGVVLEHVALTNLSLVELRGVQVARVPPRGRVLEREDLQAAVALLGLLHWMDEQMVPDKPLLREIAVVDVSNFRGRRRKEGAHIVLYTPDQTPIEWGAELETWAQYVEASDQQKLARLYTYYKERGTLQGGVKRIDLRQPSEIPQPAASY